MKWVVRLHGHVLSLQQLCYSVVGICLTLRIPKQFLGINFLLLKLHLFFNQEPLLIPEGWNGSHWGSYGACVEEPDLKSWMVGPPNQWSSWNTLLLLFSKFFIITLLQLSCYQHPGRYSTFPIRHVLLWGASSSLLTRPLTSTYWTPSMAVSQLLHLWIGIIAS